MGKKFMQGALDAVKQAKWSFADMGRRNKAGKLPVDEFKVSYTWKFIVLSLFSISLQLQFEICWASLEKL